MKGLSRLPRPPAAVAGAPSCAPAFRIASFFVVGNGLITRHTDYRAGSGGD
jgi:hypothetical protein